MKKPTYPKIGVEAEEHTLICPEAELWLAVIERAIRDYCFFFDNAFSFSSKNRWMPRTEENVHTIHCIRELQRLRWFIFEKTPEPFNMQYLLENLFDDYDEIGKQIRAQASSAFKKHIESTELKGIFRGIIGYIKANTNAMEALVTTVDVSLKNKRLRRTH